MAMKERNRPLSLSSWMIRMRGWPVLRMTKTHGAPVNVPVLRRRVIETKSVWKIRGFLWGD